MQRKNFLGSIKVILTRTPHNVEYSLNWPISCTQVRLQMAGLAYVQFSCFLRESSGNPPKILAIVKTIKCSLQADSGVPQLRKTPTQLIEHGEVICCLCGSLNPKLQSLQHNKVLCRLLKEEHAHQLSHNTFDLKSVLSVNYARVMATQNLWE